MGGKYPNQRDLHIILLIGTLKLVYFLGTFCKITGEMAALTRKSGDVFLKIRSYLGFEVTTTIKRHASCKKTYVVTFYPIKRVCFNFRF